MKNLKEELQNTQKKLQDKEDLLTKIQSQTKILDKYYLDYEKCIKKLES